MPSVFLSVLKEENVYIASDSKEINALTLINRIWMASGKQGMIYELLRIYEKLQSTE